MLFFRELSESDTDDKIQVSPAIYLQYITTLSKTYCQLFAKIEDKRNRLEKVLHKLENISGQVEELKQELSDLQPRFEQITKEIDSKKESVSQIMTQRAAGLTFYKDLENKVALMKIQLDNLQKDYDEQMANDNEKVSGTIKTIQ